MADPELIAYIRKHSRLHGDASVRTQLIRDGLPPSEIDQAFSEAQSATIRKSRNKRKLALLAVGAGGILLAMAVVLSRDPAKTPDSKDAAIEDPAVAEPSVFHGHYGYMLALPPGYRAAAEFMDAEKRRERVYIYPKGTDHSHFIHRGLYAHLGILRLDVSPRRVPQGFIGVKTLKAHVTRTLANRKATYKERDIMVHGMPGFVVTEEKPFKQVDAHMVGEKVHFILAAGVEDRLFTDIMSSLAEVDPHDRPGK